MPDLQLAGHKLCAARRLALHGQAFLFEVKRQLDILPAFVLRYHTQVVAYLNQCAHIPTNLDWIPGQFLDADQQWLICAMHGALYDPYTGQCIAGPCYGSHLIRLQVQEAEGWIWWYPTRDLQPYKR